MPDSITCPQCGLVQESPANQVCSGCARPLAAPVSPLRAALGFGKETATKVLPFGARIAGVVLLLNAAGSALSLAKDGPGTGPLANQELKSMLIDLAVGAGLVFGKAVLQKWAIVRVVLGLVVFGAVFGFQKDTTSLVVQVAFSTALLLLLVGEPGKPRIALGTALSAAYLLLMGAGLMQSYTGSNPAAAAILAGKGEISPASGRLKGQKFGYCLSVPQKQWYLRSAEAAARDNDLADRWVTRPDLDAHVMVVAQALEKDVEVDQEKLEQVVTGEMKENLTNFQDLGRKPLPGGALLHFRGHAKDLDLEYYQGVFAHKNQAYQLAAFATPKSFARAEPELAAMVASFDPECAAR